jgi:5-methylcytosine-specific restriction enzyme subunit McrC
METLFESYIAALLRKKLDPEQFTVSVQDRSHHLFEEPREVFQMKPDIVITHRDTKFILDTKWKLLSAEKANYGISQADLYQMYAYQQKYQAQNVTLLYPKTEQVPQQENIEYHAIEGVTVRVRFIDLFDPHSSLAAFTQSMIDPINR